MAGRIRLTVLRKHYDRIAYIHLKDIRQAVLDEARAEKVDFVTCIRKGVFTVPGDGCIDFAPIFKELMNRGYTGMGDAGRRAGSGGTPAYEYAKQALKLYRFPHSTRKQVTIL